MAPFMDGVQIKKIIKKKTSLCRIACKEMSTEHNTLFSKTSVFLQPNSFKNGLDEKNN